MHDGHRYGINMVYADGVIHLDLRSTCSRSRSAKRGRRRRPTGGAHTAFRLALL